MKNKVLLIFVFVAILSISIFARNESAYIKMEEAVLKKEPVGGDIIALLNHGAQVDILERGEKWTKVRVDGWVLTEALSFPDIEEKAESLEISRTNPAGLGEVISFQRFDFIDGQLDLELELLEVISGNEAWNIIKQANIYNEEPLPDEEYILAKFRIKVNKTEKDIAFNFTHVMFEAVSKMGMVYSDIMTVSGLLPNLRAVLYQGAEHSGWTYFLVKKDDKPVVVFDRQRDSEQWFRLKY